jgi:twitching motility protein PilI
MIQRPSLREFRDQLHDRLQAERDAHEPVPVARLGVLAGGEHWLVRLDEANEVLALGTIAPVPLTQAWFRGLVNVRGSLYSVIDYGHFVTGRPTATGPEARLVVLAERFRISAALLVERMLGLRTAQSLQPDDAADGLAWVGGRWRDAEGRTWREISVDALAEDARFLQAGR